MSDEPEAGSQKRVHMTMRLAPSLRSQLEQAAAANGRSLTQEAESRLSQSFDTAAAVEQAVKAAFKFALGGESAQTVALMFATTVRIVESREGKKFGESGTATTLVVEAIRHILSEIFIDTDKIHETLTPQAEDSLRDEAIFISKLVLALLKKENTPISRQMEEFFSQPKQKS